ncbi:MAG: oligopeptide/dipeptide ABC transporter ATP-binding protein [Myxococcota bacterium]|jgi:oligopeptide/dipeptide ABC transporter ATP-binding protein
MSEPLLVVDGLKTWFDTEYGTVKAVDGVSFDVRPGEVMGLVGESGSGKSVTNLSILKLVPTPPGRYAGGSIRFDGVDLLTHSEAQMRTLRGNRIAMIFQDPMTSLTPYMRISRQLCEVIELHQRVSRSEARKRALDMLDRVGIPDPSGRIDQYPHQFSGGMRQRVMIAMALACKPALLLADEPTTALDVTIQAQILELMQELAREEGTAVILVTHDLGVVAGIADKVAVMYGGRIVERASVFDLYANPQHPYTQGLLASVPRLDSRGALTPIPGSPPNLANLPTGCTFHPRCSLANEQCQIYPDWVGTKECGTACWRAGETTS